MVAKFGIVDLAYWLPDNLLERGDRMTMTSSVELRPPFLDTRVVDFALALPSRFKVRRGDTKWVVKQVAKRYVDADLIDRPKIGFAVPIDSWFRGHLAGEVRDLLCGPDSHVAQWLDAAAVRRLVDDHIAGAKHGKQLWPLVSLELWARHALDAAAPPR
ncbi:MAG: asparagine synthase C-terminal domain-containing protein [Microthrixaceae bacterium]